jgi:amino acid transporter
MEAGTREGADTSTDGGSSLRADSVGTLGLTAQSIGATGPEINALSVAPVVTAFAGALAPLAYVIATIVGVAFGTVIKRFASRIAAAGGTYRFIRAGLGGPAGVFGGMTYFLGMFIFVPFTAVLSATVFAQAGAAIFPHNHWFAEGHWFEIALVELVFAAVFVHLGVRLSVGLLIGLSIFGMTALLIFDLAILVQGGAHGLSISGLMPWHVHGVTFTSFAVALGIAMGGFFCSETPAFLAEEARDPHRTVPRAIMISIAAMMGFLVVHTYAVMIGLGTDHASIFADQGAGVVLTLAPTYLAQWYGDMLLVVLGMASLTSVVALYGASARLMYDWGRERTLPASFGRVHARHQTPTVAIGVIGVGSVIACSIGLLARGDALADGNVLWAWSLLVGVIWILTGYVLVGLSGIALHFKERRASQGPSVRAIWLAAPVVMVAGMALSIFSQMHPFPPPPYNTAPLVALIFLMGAAVLAFLWGIRQRREGGRFILTAGADARINIETAVALEESE